MAAETPRKARQRIEFDPMSERAKLVSYQIYERAKALAELMAPERPIDSEPLEPEEQWMLLELTGVRLNPAYWDDPDALRDLFKLRKQFLGTEDRYLLTQARVVDQMKRRTPSAEETPVSEEFEAQRRRLRRAS